MRATKPLAIAILLGLGACAAAPRSKGSDDEQQKPLRGGVVEFRLISYDGRRVEARILVGATVDPIVMHGPLLDGANVELNNVRVCETKKYLHYARPDLVSSREDIAPVTVRPGYWYGEKVLFLSFFDETGRLTDLGPDCFEADLVVFPQNGLLAGALPIRVERTDKPKAQPDGGAEPPKPPGPDGGTP